MRRDRTETDIETETERARESARERCSRTSRQTDSLHAPARIKEPRAHCVKMRWGHRWGWSAAESGDLRRVVCRKCLTLLAFRDQVRTKWFLHAWSSLPACLPPSSLPFSTHSPPPISHTLALARALSLTHSFTHWCQIALVCHPLLSCLLFPPTSFPLSLRILFCLLSSFCAAIVPIETRLVSSSASSVARISCFISLLPSRRRRSITLRIRRKRANFLFSWLLIAYHGHDDNKAAELRRARMRT